MKQVIRKLAETPERLRYQTLRNAKRGNYETWLLQQEHAQKMREELEALDGEDHMSEGYFGEQPIRAIQIYFLRHEETKILYGDEDVLTEKGPSSPWFRPDWSPELLESCFYLGSIIAVHKELLSEVIPDWMEKMGEFVLYPEDDEATLNPEFWERRKKKAKAVVFRNEKPSEEYRKLIFLLCEKAGGWNRGCKAIAHLPGILHHCEKEENLLAFSNLDWGYHRQEEMAGEAPLLSVIIPSKDNPELLKSCLTSLREAAKGAWEDGTDLPLEVIVIDNGSSEENWQKIKEIPEIEYHWEPMPFNFAKMCNLGAAKATGKLLLFLNDDVRLLSESRLGELARLAERPGVGSVGIKLYYPDGKKIQHAGITNLPMGPVHKLQFLEDDEVYYFGMNRGKRNVLAVTAACVMIEKEKFREAGGFDETLQVAFNDVALGFRLWQLGLRNVCDCDAYAYHHESLTRGSDEGEQQLERLLTERERLREMFPDLERKDPYYSAYLGRQGLDTRVRPAYETAKNGCQNASIRKTEDLEAFREDPCLMMRVEDVYGGELYGYAVVLGDDNACYEFRLLLESEDGEKYDTTLYPQYRPDLEENMPDQRHVALCGFWVNLSKGSLAPGKYRLGCLADRKIGNQKLLSWTNRSLWVK